MKHTLNATDENTRLIDFTAEFPKCLMDCFSQFTVGQGRSKEFVSSTPRPLFYAPSPSKVKGSAFLEEGVNVFGNEIGVRLAILRFLSFL